MKHLNKFVAVCILAMISLYVVCKFPSADDNDDTGGSSTLWVKFDANGGTGSIDSMAFSPGDTKNLTHNNGEISRSGYRFISWNTAPDRSGTEYIQQKSVTLTDSDLTLYAQWYKVYEIGENGPGGGLVFYKRYNADDIILNYPEWIYLEAAPATSETELKWGETTSAYVINETFTDTPGSGKENTDLITAKFSGDYAAQYCQSLTVGGKNDWYLPTRVELAYMYEKLFKSSLGGFETDKPYWSSRQGNYSSATPTGEQYAYVMIFDADISGYTQLNAHTKGNKYYVRAVRRF
jgi:hypothetical protein